MLFLKKLHQIILSFFSAFKSLSLLIRINFVSLSLLLFLSPVYGAFWLLLAISYFLFKGSYKNIFIAWGIFFCAWYFFFIVFLFDFESQILIGDEYTLKILMHILDKYSIDKAPWYARVFEGFCLQTVFLLNILSDKLGFPIYVPSLIKVFISLLKYIFGGDKGAANCAGEESSKKGGASANEFGSIFSSIFKKSAVTKPKVDADFDACASFRRDLEKHWNLYPIKKKSGVSGTEHVTYVEAKIPFYNLFIGCISRNATKEEIINDKNKKG